MPLTVLLINVLGWGSMVVLVSAYALVTSGRVAGTSLAFQLMNLLGGAGLMINSAYYSAYPSAALNLVWVGVGIVGLLRARRARRARRDRRDRRGRSSVLDPG